MIDFRMHHYCMHVCINQRACFAMLALQLAHRPSNDMAKSAGYLSRAKKSTIAPEEQKSPPNIAAIDFGSSSVSLAYSINHSPEVHTLKLHRSYERVPNAILIKEDNNGDHTVDQFGQLAQERYYKLPPTEREKYIYFERIKILLERSENIHRKSEVWSLTGRKFYLVEVIAFIIAYLKDKLLMTLTVPDGKPQFKSTDFDWVITVPAIWKARAKRMMREAAYMAGLTSDNPGIAKFTPFGNAVPRPPETNPDKLFLALEPEVAAIFTQSEVKEPAERLPPQRYMVVDIGGGTVDITVHDQREGKVDVIVPPTGNMWGGITVNQACESILGKIFNDEGFKNYSQEYPDDITTISGLVFVEFEKEKKMFGDEANLTLTDSLNIPLPRKVVDFYGQRQIKGGAESINAKFEDDTISIEYGVVKEKMFQTTVKHIVDCIMKAFDEFQPTKVDTIYLVGGFGGCEFMYTALHKALSKHQGTFYDKIVRPHLRDLAVVRGAVMWRQDPSIIQSRKADATYGICVNLGFNPSKHDRHYQYRNEDGMLRCAKVFSVFIEKGEVAGLSDIYIASNLTPPCQAITQMCISIYSTPIIGIQYTIDKSNQPTVIEIGKLIIDIPNPDNKPRNEREMEVSMSFSGTEIHAKAKYCITGEEVKTVCDFLTHQYQ